ncbi:MAG TPA: phage tail sheath subtilisin-like domain-containing protein [Pyrinomonadaceae bacterium]|nr:phage tail sheath subtilisin-like domain-containing protein [Pyrinomonadaceae bacterium]
MSTPLLNLPGVRIQEVRLGAPPIAGVGTSTAAFVGKSPFSTAFVNVARQVTSADQFIKDYIRDAAAPDDETKGAQTNTLLSAAVLGFFQNGGTDCYIVDVGSEAPADVVAGIARLEKIEEIDIIAAPGIANKDVYAALKGQAEGMRNRFAIYDPPLEVTDLANLSKPPAAIPPPPGTEDGLRPPDSIWAGFYFPWVQISPFLKKDKDDLKADPNKQFFAPPSGHVAGLYARVDGARGVHKAPANEVLLGTVGVKRAVTDAEQNGLNENSVNIIRAFAAGPTVFGARTLQLAATPLDLSFRYISVRRLTTFIEQSLRIGLRFAVFEPNNLALRQIITRSVRGFLDGVWRDGALFGATADEAYYVRFPDPFNTDTERALGRLTLEVGIRPAPPAEFIIIRIGLLDRPANATT